MEFWQNSNGGLSLMGLYLGETVTGVQVKELELKVMMTEFSGNGKRIDQHTEFMIWSASWRDFHETMAELFRLEDEYPGDIQVCLKCGTVCLTGIEISSEAAEMFQDWFKENVKVTRPVG